MGGLLFLAASGCRLGDLIGEPATAEDRAIVERLCRTRFVILARAVSRHRAAARAGAITLAASQFRPDANVQPGALAILPPALASIEDREGWDAKTGGQTPGGRGARLGVASGRLAATAAQRARIAKLKPRQQFLQFSLIKADHVQIEVFVAQRRQFRGKHRVVPPGIFGNPVVGEDKRPALGLRQMVQDDHRHLGQAEALCSQEPTVPGDDHVVLTNQDRIGKTKLGHRCRDLRHLIGGMGAGVADIGHQPDGFHHVDLQGAIS